MAYHLDLNSFFCSLKLKKQALIFICFAGLFFSFSSFIIHDSYAQRADQFSRSYLTPFPKGNQYKVFVVGDALAAGVQNGLLDAFENDKRVEIKGAIKYRSGLARVRSFSWKNHVRSLLRQEKIHAVVMLVGLGERRNIRYKGKTQKFGEDAWAKTMSGRVRDLLKVLKDSKVAVYWVGLPIMRSPKQNEAMQRLNSIFREQSFLKGLKFIDTWNGFADQFGRYSAYGADLSGKVRRLRDNDGVQFTKSGYRKLAHFVEREIRRDIALARSERNIPLAGDEKEQDRIRNVLKPKVPKRNQKTEKETKEQEGFFSALQKRLLGAGKTQQKTQKSNPSVAVVDGIKIVRPPLSEFSISRAVVRRNNAALISADIGSGVLAKSVGRDLTALATVTPLNDLSLKAAEQRVPLQQTPYYKVLVLGEALEAKPGRADDFSWSQK